MSLKRRLKEVEEKLRAGKGKSMLLVNVFDKGEEKGKPCPLKSEDTEKLKECPIYQGKVKKALGREPGEGEIMFTLFGIDTSNYPPGGQEPIVVSLDCQDNCPYLQEESQ